MKVSTPVNSNNGSPFNLFRFFVFASGTVYQYPRITLLWRVLYMKVYSNEAKDFPLSFEPRSYYQEAGTLSIKTHIAKIRSGYIRLG